MYENIEELKDVIKSDLEPRFRKQFINGCIAGFASAVMSMQKATSSFTSAKQYKEYMVAKVNEVKDKLKLSDEQIM